MEKKSDSGTQFLDSISQKIANKIKLTIAEERELIIRHRAGDQTSLDLLIQANKGFVISIANKYNGMNASAEDLVSAGYLGFITAIDKFDIKCEVKFITFAESHIKREIINAYCEFNEVIRIPQNRRKELSTIYKTTLSIEQQTGHSPTTEELETVTGINKHRIYKLLQCSSPHLSLHAQTGNKETLLLIDTLEDQNIPLADHRLDNESKTNALKAALQILSEREIGVLSMLFGLDCQPPKTLKEIAKHYNVGTDSIRNTKENALYKLRNSEIRKELITTLQNEI